MTTAVQSIIRDILAIELEEGISFSSMLSTYGVNSFSLSAPLETANLVTMATKAAADITTPLMKKPLVAGRGH